MVKTAKDIMTSKLVTVSHKETIAKAVSKMDEYDVKEIPIVNDKSELVGEITYYDILDSPKSDSTEEVDKLMVNPPIAAPETDLNELATLIVDSGIEAVPIVKDKKIIGIVSDYDILRESLEDPRIKNLKIKEIMRIPPRFFNGDEPISTARRIMRYYNIDRLPIITKDGRSQGLILSIDILRMFYRNQTKKMERLSGEKVNAFNLPVKGIMRTDIPEVNMNDTVSSVAKKMLEKHLRGLQVLDNAGKVVGIVFRLDILDRLVEKKFRDGIWLKFSGEQIPYDQVEAVKNYIATDIKKIKHYLPTLTSVDIHIKKVHAATPDKWNYEVNVMLVKTAGPRVSVRALYGYNLMFTVDEAIQKLLKQLERKYKEREGKKGTHY